MSRPAYGTRDAAYQPVHGQSFVSDKHYSSSSVPSLDEIDRAYGYSSAGGVAGAGGRQAVKRSAASKRKMIWAIVIGVIVLAIVGAVVGAVIGITRKSNSNASAASAASTAAPDSGVVSGGTTSGSTSDSKFTLDTRLKKSFWGMAYTPPNAAYYPTCGDTIEGVVKDIQLISQLTTRIRLYGADCNQSALVLDAIQRTQTNLSVYLGVYMDINDPTIYTRQLKETMNVLSTFKPSNVLGITVGNEILLQAQSAGASVTQALADVTANIRSVKSAVAAMGLSIPVGSGDAGSMLTEAYGAACDFVFSNNHPFFSGVTIQNAATWTWNYINTDTPAVVNTAPNKPALMQGEVGWPTNAIPGGSLSLNGSAASMANSQTFLDTWVCASNTNRTQYIYFEAFDEAWKMIYNGSEPFWGLFDKNRVFKNLTIPTCLVDY